MNALEKFVTETKTPLAEIARRVGVQRAAVSKWKRNRIPAERVHDVAAATGIAAHDLRPDIFVPPEKLPAPAA